MIDLKAALAKVKAEKSEWHRRYLSAVERASAAGGGQNGFTTLTFQQWLWRHCDDAISIGQGDAIAVGDRAFQDPTLVSQLDELRRAEGRVDVLQGLFEGILSYVHERYAVSRPRARLIRIFALLRPWDVTCIVWDERLRWALRRMDETPPRGGLMLKHRFLIDTLWRHLGKPDTLDEQIWYSILAHQLSMMDATDVGEGEASDPVDDITDAAPETPTDDPSKWLRRLPGELPPLPFDAIRDAFTALAGDRFVFDPAMLRTLHAALTALPDKRFVVIGGLSGTGKTSFARLYSAAVCAALGLDDPDAHRRFIAVRPDWTDPSGLLGHANLLLDPPKWHRTPALGLLMTARAHPAKPYFLILEEMNLALVEHYLAPLLAAMENPESGLAIHGEPRAIQGVPPLMPWPRNLFIIGTVNMDATTHAFSDKVLDRAFIWELDAIDVEAWRDRERAAESPSPHVEVVADLLARVYAPLADARRHFGYRVCDEVLGFCDAAGEASAAVLDAAVFSKVLPRLRGDDQGGLDRAIGDVLAICRDARLDRCTRRLERMRRALAETGVARFWS